MTTTELAPSLLPASLEAAPDRPTNVVAALARVMAELPGIGKTDDSSQGYQYRGIESITRHTQHLLGKHGVVFVPRVLSRAVRELTINGRPWTEDQAEVVYRVYGPGGVEDFIDVGPIWGIGRDNSDKGMNKCQPPGTMVRVPVGGARGGHADSHCDWTQVPIESLQTGDRVVTWQRVRSALRPTGRVITGVAARPYEGKLVTVAADGRFSRYTPDHRCLVRLPTRLADGNEVVYLMRRGDQYRIGRCRWRGDRSDGRRSRIGLSYRSASEGADAAWVLSVHGTVAEAAMAEVLASVRFGIPQTSFTGNTDVHRQRRSAAFDLDSFWSKIGNNTPQAADCLVHFGRLIGSPLFERYPERSQIGTLPTMLTAAANLLTGMMVGIPSDPITNDHGWKSWPVQWSPAVVGSEFYSGLVHSMDVDVDHNYVADGVLTGNCMTQAFKYALTQTLCIGDGKDDADREQAHEADAAPPPLDPAKEARGQMALRIRQLSPAGRDSVRAWCDASGVSRVTAQWSDEQLSAAEEFVDRIVQVAEADAKAHESAQEPNLAPIPPETADEPQTAPDDVPAPEDAAATAELVRAHDECWAMKLGQVRERLAELGLSLEGKPDEVRNRLEAELVRLRLGGKDVAAMPKHPMPAPDAFPDSL